MTATTFLNGRCSPVRAPTLAGPCGRRSPAVAAHADATAFQLTLRCFLQVTMEDYPEAGMSALKYYTIQSYTK